MPQPSPQTSTEPRGRRLAPALAIIVALGLATTARADGPLRWKFEKGRTLRYSFVQKLKTEQKAGQFQGGTTVDQVSDVVWTVDDVSPEGVASITQLIGRIRIKLDIAGQPPFDYDSEAKDRKYEGPIATQALPMLKALEGFKCSFKLDPRGRVDSVTIPPGVVDELKKNFAGGMAGSWLSEEAIKNTIAESSLVLPEEAVEKGKTWTDRSRQEVPRVGAIVTEKTYTVDGPDPADPTKVKISVAAKVSVEGGDNPQVKFDIKEQKHEGTFEFDAANGRVAGSHVAIGMVQVISAGPQTLQQSLDNTMEMNLAPETAAP